MKPVIVSDHGTAALGKGAVASRAFVDRGLQENLDAGRIYGIAHAYSGSDLAHMPAPIPNHEAEENADGNFLWPNGKDAAAEHGSHVIVTNIGTCDQTPVQSAIAVSRLGAVRK